MATSEVMHPRVVSGTEWLEARKSLLAKEKELTRQRDLVSAERRRLPWIKVEKNYVFDTTNGRQTLSDLFGGNSQLIVYHFMWRKEYGEGCVGCSFLSDHVDGANQHLATALWGAFLLLVMIVRSVWASHLRLLFQSRR